MRKRRMRIKIRKMIIASCALNESFS